MSQSDGAPADRRSSDLCAGRRLETLIGTSCCEAAPALSRSRVELCRQFDGDRDVDVRPLNLS